MTPYKVLHGGAGNSCKGAAVRGGLTPETPGRREQWWSKEQEVAGDTAVPWAQAPALYVASPKGQSVSCGNNIVGGDACSEGELGKREGKCFL